ncbi:MULTISPECIES: SHOCT domain-containing protein [Sulfurimonas]|uniref:SHOCT domain-containing protein n=1 Tax=Sulfurimonas TaxID=202746 RepID=UPI001263FCF8|nr:SHOCT domain-containing protein [Sulfurimonas indica]
MHGFEFGMGFGWIIPLILIFWLFYLIGNTREKEESAQDILDKKYANGEINEEEYKRRKANLKH